MAITRHIYSKDGEHVYYRVENNIYEPGGARAFWVIDICWHSLEGGPSTANEATGYTAKT